MQGLLALVKEHVRGQDDVEADTMCTLRNRYITHHHHLLTSISIQLFILQYCTSVVTRSGW